MISSLWLLFSELSHTWKYDKKIIFYLYNNKIFYSILN